MAEATRQSGLQVREDRAWQENLWTAQRVAWAVMALVVAAALLGATGKGGPLANSTIETGGAVIDYPRITRWQSADQLTIRLPAHASGTVDVELSKAFVDTFTIESLEPEPSEVSATTAGHRFSFLVDGGAGEKSVVFNLKAGKAALALPIEARVGSGEPAQFTMTVLP